MTFHDSIKSALSGMMQNFTGCVNVVQVLCVEEHRLQQATAANGPGVDVSTAPY